MNTTPASPHVQPSHPLKLINIIILISTLFFISFFSSQATSNLATEKDSTEYKLDYIFKLKPQDGTVEVTITIDRSKLIKSVKLSTEDGRHSHFSGDGDLKVYKNHILWKPGKGVQSLTYTSTVNRKKGEKGYDALMNEAWAIFRTDKIVPSATVRSVKGAKSNAQLHIEMPASWSSVDTGWLRSKENTFEIDDPKRAFDRPTGWFIAGNIGIRRDFLDGTQVSVAAPIDNQMPRMETLTLINLVWPEVRRAFSVLPKKILIVGAADPMWRGGLSAPNSFYLHSGRPSVSENGTSPVLHELVHVITRLRAKHHSDWIVEGIAEFYSIELMLRSGAMNKARHKRTLRNLRQWSKGVTSLRVKRSTGPVTAKAVLVLYELNKEIKKTSNGQYSLDDITRELMGKRIISNKTLSRAVENLIGHPSKVLQQSLMR